MSRVRPILFNTDMVRAILDGRKTVTRRLVKPQHLKVLNSPHHKEHPEVEDVTLLRKLCEPPCKPGDILYVRETYYKDKNCVFYKASNPNLAGYRSMDGEDIKIKWRPSIHMPKEAARIWLKVTNVRVERLQDITIDGCQEEGCWCGHNGDIFAFISLWDSTIKKPGIAQYGWNANPWVWVIEFERCEKPKEEMHE